MPTIEERVLRIIANERQDIIIEKGADLFKDLAFESIELMELIMALEDEFNINIPDKMYDNVKTPEDIIYMIEKHCDLANDTCE